MKPLRSPIREFRIRGAMDLVLALTVGVIAATEHRPVRVLFSVLVGAAIFGGGMYVVAYRRYLREAVRNPRQAPPDAACEAPASTWRRVAVGGLGLDVPLLAFAFVLRNPAILAGIAAGNGAALITLSRWVQRWQDEHGAELLREPRYRWRRSDKHRGRGILDSRDFYVRPRTG
jgi:hypothetical protein